MEENPLLDLLAKKLFKNVKRRRLTEEEKRRLRNVTREIQNQMNWLQDIRSDNKDNKSHDKSKKPRRRLTWHLND